jgi:PLP dependent protein
MTSADGGRAAPGAAADEPVGARRHELAAGLAQVHARIARAMEAAGRTDEPALVVVTKFFPASDVDLLAALGVTAIGENRDQEAAAKCAELVSRDRLTVHFIGQLQSNKAASVARYADVVQSVDRAKVVRALDRGAQQAGRTLEVTVQVNLDEAQGRGGVAPAEARALADQVADFPSLTLRGVMAVAPLGGDARAAFARLRAVADGIRADHPGATWVSAGMSGDLEAAVAEGATHLRVGSAILGSRQPHR